jgi:Domain of unknown function (DUF4124)
MRTLMVAVVVAVLASAVHAADVYHWTDEKGVVHFADAPPPHVKAETRTLPLAQPMSRPAATGDAAAPPPVAPDEAKGSDAAAAHAASGPARIVITRQDEQRLGGQRHEYSGVVKNEGGSPAHGVAITIHVTETQQGDDCLSDEIAVEPPTLAPGDTARFTAEYSHPCFAGETRTSFEAVWD